MRPPPLSFLQVKPPCPAAQSAPEEHGTPASAPARWSLFVVVDDTAFRPTVGTELPAQLPAAGPGRTHRHRELRSGLTASEAGPPGHRALRGRPGGDGGCGAGPREAGERRGGELPGWAARAPPRLGRRGVDGLSARGRGWDGAFRQGGGGQARRAPNGRGGTERQGTGSPGAEAVRARGGR